MIATDPDGDSLSYALSGEFQSRFSISGSGNLTVAETPKLTIPEHTEVYLDVTVSDGNGGSARTWLKIDVDPDPNAPYVPPEVHGLSAQPGDGQATLI